MHALKEAEVPVYLFLELYTPERRPANAEDRLADGKSSIALASTLVTTRHKHFLFLRTVPYYHYFIQSFQNPQSRLSSVYFQ